MGEVSTMGMEGPAAGIGAGAAESMGDGPPPGSGFERVLGHLPARGPGPTLIVVAGLHGNEPAGVHGLRRILAALADRRDELRGSFVALGGNLPALAAGRRYLDRDLNRLWQRKTVERLRAGDEPSCIEEHELRALDLELRAAIANATGPVFVLDMHTTSAPGPPFVVLNDTLANRAFALRYPVPVVLGLEEELAGTLLNFLSHTVDVTSIGFESGQHDEPAAIDQAAAAIWLALRSSGVIEGDGWPEVEAAHDSMAALGEPLPSMVDVHHRHHIEPGDGFEMARGFAGFQPVTAGQLLGHDCKGPVHAPQDGLLLMPLYQGQGEDGFFIVREVQRIWLRLSKLLRRLRLEGYLHLLPGIRRHPTRQDAVIVDTRIAVVLAVELFHLLGFTRVGEIEGRYVTMRRRRFDR